jgi:hypothetical protein
MFAKIKRAICIELEKHDQADWRVSFLFQQQSPISTTFQTNQTKSNQAQKLAKSIIVCVLLDISSIDDF